MNSHLYETKENFKKTQRSRIDIYLLIKTPYKNGNRVLMTEKKSWEEIRAYRAKFEVKEIRAYRAKFEVKTKRENILRVNR